MNTGDMIRTWYERTDCYLYWEVWAIYIGGEGEESVVELRPLGQKPNRHGLTLVPMAFLDGAELTHFTQVTP